MANAVSPKKANEMKSKAITYKVLCGIVKLYGEATLPEIRAKYKSVARPWNLPYLWVSEESAQGYLNQGVKNGLLKYERRRQGVVIERRLKGMSDGTGYYIWIGSEDEE
ncbi:MAG: hypothetical protein GOVbin4933_66 [Prokaryotic dsDNA virus sp.]|nr:MAG: hypothetical protein GOVbin4933_66 [Prokaryotic dsDNA virus sp.]|tara:strand:+ start:3996 stop:4322 length:327 start_codon:yes stop_codon:yes gene_type:complete